MARDSTKGPEAPRSVITREQWDMPVSLDAEGGFVPLRAYVKKGHNGPAFTSLSKDQQLEVVLKRIEMDPECDMASIETGIISRERAVDEVRAGTILGQRLAEIEARVIKHLLEEATREE